MNATRKRLIPNSVLKNKLFPHVADTSWLNNKMLPYDVNSAKKQVNTEENKHHIVGKYLF